MKKIVNFFKLHYKKIIASVSCLTLLLVVGFGLMKPKQVNASDSFNIQDYYIATFTDTYFENNYNYEFKSSRANFNWFDTLYGVCNFGIGNYTYKNEFLSRSKYEFFDNSSIIPNRLDALVGRYQVGSNNSQTVFYTEHTSNYLNISLENVVVPIPTEIQSYYGYQSLYNNIVESDIFAYSLSKYFKGLFLYPNSTDLNTRYHVNFTLQALEQNIDSDSNSAFNVNSGVVDLYYDANAFQPLDKIFTYNYFESAYNNFILTYPFSDVYFPLYYIEYGSSLLKSQNEFYFVLSNLNFGIELDSDVSSLFYFVEVPDNDLYIYDNLFQSFAPVLAQGELLPNNADDIFNFGISVGYDDGYGDGYDIGYVNGEYYGYNTGYNQAVDDTFESNSPFGMILGAVEDFLQFQIFPDFPLYYFLLMALGFSIFSLLLKFAFGG